jgi:hypothetical protein
MSEWSRIKDAEFNQKAALKEESMVIRGYTTNLANCPFCGGKKLIVARFIADYWRQCVRCESCRAEGPAVKEDQFTTQQSATSSAIDCWNARP